MAFQAGDVAFQMVSEVGPLLAKLRCRDADLADQVRRAASSVVLNVAEGNRREGKDRYQMWRIAAGSAAEVQAALRVATAWGYLEEPAAVLKLLDRLLAMLWRLTHPVRG